MIAFSPIRSLLTAAIVLLSVAGCSTTSNMVPNEITVEGRAVVMGNEPFTRLILFTESKNSYILVLEQPVRDSLMTPADVRVRGIVSRGEWNGQPYASIQVLQLESVE